MVAGMYSQESEKNQLNSLNHNQIITILLLTSPDMHLIMASWFVVILILHELPGA